MLIGKFSKTQRGGLLRKGKPPYAPLSPSLDRFVLTSPKVFSLKTQIALAALFAYSNSVRIYKFCAISIVSHYLR